MKNNYLMIYKKPHKHVKNKLSNMLTSNIQMIQNCEKKCYDTETMKLMIMNR